MTRKTRTILMLFLFVLFAMMVAPNHACAYRGRKAAASKKKKIVPKQQVQIRVPYTKEDREKNEHVNRWKYYQGELEKNFGNNLKRDAGFLRRAGKELRTLKNYYPRHERILEDGALLYDSFITKTKKRRMSRAEMSIVQDNLVEFRRSLASRIREFQERGLLGK